MKLYYVNANPQANGDYEVHISDCDFVPNFINRKFLGYFPSCKEALKDAKKTYPQSNGCKSCSPDCHKS